MEEPKRFMLPPSPYTRFIIWGQFDDVVGPRCMALWGLFDGDGNCLTEDDIIEAIESKPPMDPCRGTLHGRRDSQRVTMPS